MSLKRKYTIFFILLSLVSTFLHSQVWIARYNGEANLDDCAVALVVDEQGNVYVTGYSYGLSNQKCYLTIKYNPNGETLWTRSYQGSRHSEAKGLIIDSEGNVYVTGWSEGISSSRDIYTVKYNPSGEALWSRRYNGSNNQDDEPTKMVIDSRDNIYITGFSFNTESNYDYVTIKYDKNGIELWIRSYNGPGDSTDKANSIAVDRDGNVYITGTSYGLGTRGDFATIKYDSSGNTVWVQRYDDTLNIWLDDEALGIGLDSLNNVYVSGLTFSEHIPLFRTFTIIKYNQLGMEQWIADSYPGASDDILYAMFVDRNGNVYLTGADVWWNIFRNYKTEMYDSSGQRLWVAGYDADSGYDFSNNIIIDDSGNVYVTGTSARRISSHEFDYATIQYNHIGNEQWVARYNGPGDDDDEAIAINIDRAGNIYVAGRSKGLNTSYDYCTIKYLPSGPWVKEQMLINVKRSILEIYPNPVKGVLCVRGPFSEKTVKIFDITGKMIKEIATAASRFASHSIGTRFALRNDGEDVISLKGINPGIYFLRIGEEVKKFLVVK